MTASNASTPHTLRIDHIVGTDDAGFVSVFRHVINSIADELADDNGMFGFSAYRDVIESIVDNRNQFIIGKVNEHVLGYELWHLSDDKLRSQYTIFLDFRH